MKNITQPNFIQLAHTVAEELNGRVERNFEDFLRFVYDKPLAVNKKGGTLLTDKSSEEDCRKFLTAYLRENFAARSKRIVLNSVGTVADPAVEAVLIRFGKHHPDLVKEMHRAHRASMAAESKIGQLLEAYIATVLEPKGWFWCACNILKGADFFRPAKHGKKSMLLQIKNRSNSENSSSSEIRNSLRAKTGLAIEKWHRIESDSTETHWNDLTDAGGQLSETGFMNFIGTYEVS